MSNHLSILAREKPRPSQPGAPALNATAKSYVAGIIIASLLASALAMAQSGLGSVETILLWAEVALVGQLMTFSTLTGRGSVSLGTCTDLAMLLLLPPGEFLPAIWLSRIVANFCFQRKVWYRALFNGAQVTGALLIASIVYKATRASVGGGFSAAELLRNGPGFLVAALVYYAVNMGAVSGILALTSGQSLRAAWRENFGYRAELVSTVALALLAPIAALTYHHLGGVGLIVFLAPMLLIRDASQRYIALRRAQQALVAAERLAAKGELAAEIGHEMNNSLTVVQCELQLLAKRSESLSAVDQRRLVVALEHVGNIASLSKGLMDFTRRDSTPIPTRLNDLVERTVGFLKPQNRFDHVRLELALDARIEEVRVDPGQLQQVLINLLLNAANAMAESGTGSRVLRVWTNLCDLQGTVEIGVADSGPGVPAEFRERIFEPGFTTRQNGHGFGLSTAHRIVTNHGGTIRLEEAAEGGALFRVTLPGQTLQARAA